MKKDLKMKTKLLLFEVYNKALFINYKQEYITYNNEYFNNDPWHCIEWFYIRLYFNIFNIFKKFNIENGYYDGNTYKHLHFLGFSIGYGFSYIAKPKTEKLF